MAESLVSAYPLEWPAGFQRAKRRREPKFQRWTLKYCKDEITRELRLFSAQKVIVSTNQDVRIDGGFYARTRRLDDPGAAVYFTKGGEQLVIACDSFYELEDNLHAIARTINAMRQMERDGSSEILKQAFRGFKALPETAGGGGWWKVLDVSVNASAEQINEAYRKLAKEHHPDNGGDANMFNIITRAKEQALNGLKRS